MHHLTTTITTELFESLTFKAAMWDLYQFKMLPEFKAALVLLAVFGAAVVALMYLLHHASRENEQLHDVINQMHREDNQKQKFPDSVKEADARVVYEAHRSE